VRRARPVSAAARKPPPDALSAFGPSLEPIARLTAAVARAETLDDIYAAALDTVQATLGVDRAAVLLVDPDGVMRFKAWRGLSDRYRRATEGHSPWPAGTTAAEPILIEDVRADESLAGFRATLRAEGIGALAFFPVLQPGRLLGKFMAYCDAPHRFTSADLRLGRLIADHVTFAVERMRAETALRDRERELADFFEHAPMGLHWVGPDGTILRVNRSELELLGYAREEYVGRHIADFHVDRPVIDDILARLGRGETLAGYEARMRHKDGSVREVLIDSSGLWADGRFVHTRCFTRDVTDRKHLDEVQHRLAAIVDSSNDAIISKNLQGIVQTWNPAAERLFGYTAAEAIGRSITMLIPPESIQEEEMILERLRRGLRIEHYETVRLTKSGRRVDISLQISPVRDHTGRITGASKIARDISESRRAQREYAELLVREQAARGEAEAANRAKDDFLATLSHELRTPLNSILGWAQVLGSARQDPAIVDRALETITRNGRQQARLIEDLLDLSSILGGRLRLNVQPVDLVAVLAAALESIRPAAAEKELELTTAFDPSVGPVSGDPGRLQQVFWNLLTNAVKFSPQGGRVDVQVTREGTQSIVRVTDTGIGIRPEVLPVIFERFRQADSSVTRAHGGLGLGLAIVRELVGLHGGTVEAASPGEGRGATFSVRLPVGAAAVPLHGQAPRATAFERCDGIHALLVDDEADGRELLAVFLGQQGALVTAVESAAAALTAIERARPDVLVSDIAMPAMDGHELIRRVRALPGGDRIPAIALTAHASANARVEARRAGYDVYLAKPVDPAELAVALRRLARRPGP
jgi:PAS domain S-box-containing protein